MADPPPPLFLDQTEARKAEKKILETAPPFPPTLYVFERDNICQYKVYEKGTFPEWWFLNSYTCHQLNNYKQLKQFNKEMKGCFSKPL